MSTHACIASHKSKKVALQGLSHYLEHMLFMGSEKYPDENEYDSFLAKYGGSSNAYTEMVIPIYPSLPTPFPCDHKFQTCSMWPSR